MFIWGIIYATAQRRIPGDTHSVKGLVCGIFIWLIVMILIMPLGDAGFFATRYGLKAAFYILILDLIFVETLALTYKALNKREA